MADHEMSQEEDSLSNSFSPVKVQYTWKPTSEPIICSQNSNKRSLITDGTMFTSHSATNSPATQARLSTSTNNPFLIENMNETLTDVDTSEFAHLFEERHQHTNYDEDGESLIDLSNFSKDSEFEEQISENSYAHSGQYQTSDQDLLSEIESLPAPVQPSCNKNIKKFTQKYVHQSDLIQTTDEAKSYKPTRPPRLVSTHTQVSTVAVSKRTQTTPRDKNMELRDQKQQEDLKFVKSQTTAPHDTLCHRPRVYGQNFKYMKGYIKTVIQHPYDNGCLILETNTQQDGIGKITITKEGSSKINSNKKRANTVEYPGTKVLSKEKVLNKDGMDQDLLKRSTTIEKQPFNHQKMQKTKNRNKKNEEKSIKAETTNNRQLEKLEISRERNRSQITSPPKNSSKLNDLKTRLNEKSSSHQNRSINKDEDSHRKIVKLEQELKSAEKKIYNLENINAKALSRKDELQTEILDACKKYSSLEISSNIYERNQRALSLQILHLNEKIAEAERKGSQAISRANKLEHELKVSEKKRQKYYDELTTSEKRVAILEIELKEAKDNLRIGLSDKKKFQQALEGKENELLLKKKICDELETLCQRKEDNYKLTTEKLNLATKERAKHEGKIEELVKVNTALTEDLQRMQKKYEVLQTNFDQCLISITEQKEKYDSMISIRKNQERELQEVQTALSRLRVENHQHLEKQKELLDRTSENKTLLAKSKEECEHLQKENSSLKEKVLYLELYKKIGDEKSNKSPKLNESDKNEINLNAQQQYSEIKEISQKLQSLRREHDTLHEEVLKSYGSNHSNQSHKHISDTAESQKLASDKKHIRFLLDEEPPENDHQNIQHIPDDDIFQNDGIMDDSTSQQEDDTSEFVTDENCFSPIDLDVNLQERRINYPSFTSSVSNLNFQNNESNFSDLLHAGNNDIANALL